MQAIGDSFVVFPPNCADETIIVGRNSEDATIVGVSQEICFYDTKESVDSGKADGGATPNNLADEKFRLILQKPRPGIFGADYGANEKNVCIGITWADQEEIENECLLATDIVRYALATSSSAADAVDTCGALVTSYGNEAIKFNLLICDAKEAWTFSCGGKLWAAKKLLATFQRLPSDGMTVTTTIDRSSVELEAALKTLGLWNGDSPLNFAACFNAEATEPTTWSGAQPTGNGNYTLSSMFETLRSAASATSSRAAALSVLTSVGITSHWFTGTPNACESVFKPFVFAPNPKISPLTTISSSADDKETTLLHKLHAQRKPAAVKDLKDLEASCVQEVAAYLAEHPTPDAELDELLKDCVEAEVKFYR